MGRLVRWLDAKLYPTFQHRWDDSLFRQRILSHLASGDLDILDLGAGAGIVDEMDFRGHARHICGIDPDPRVVDNPYLDEGQEGVGESIPYSDASFDLGGRCQDPYRDAEERRGNAGFGLCQPLRPLRKKRHSPRRAEFLRRFRRAGCIAVYGSFCVCGFGVRSMCYRNRRRVKKAADADCTLNSSYDLLNSPLVVPHG